MALWNGKGVFWFLLYKIASLDCTLKGAVGSRALANFRGPILQFEGVIISKNQNRV